MRVLLQHLDSQARLGLARIKYRVSCPELQSLRRLLRVCSTRESVWMCLGALGFGAKGFRVGGYNWKGRAAGREPVIK